MDYKLLSRRALFHLLQTVEKVAELYAYGYNVRLRHNEEVPLITSADECNITTSVNTSLIANSLVYYVCKQGGEECNMINEQGRIYPAKVLGKIYSPTLKGPNGKWACKTAKELNTILAVYKSYPATSMFNVVHNVFICDYLDACRTTLTPVFSAADKNVYVSKSVNRIICFIADIFAVKLNIKRCDEIVPIREFVRDLLQNTDVEEDNDDTSVSEEEDIEPVSEAQPEPVAVQEERATLTEEDFLSMLASMDDEGKAHWEEKLKKTLEDKKAPYVAQMQQISKEILELETKLAELAKKVERIGKIETTLQVLFSKE